MSCVRYTFGVNYYSYPLSVSNYAGKCLVIQRIAIMISPPLGILNSSNFFIIRRKHGGD
jgi:hypothetical protein